MSLTTVHIRLNLRKMETSPESRVSATTKAHRELTGRKTTERQRHRRHRFMRHPRCVRGSQRPRCPSRRRGGPQAIRIRTTGFGVSPAWFRIVLCSARCARRPVAVGRRVAARQEGDFCSSDTGTAGRTWSRPATSWACSQSLGSTGGSERCFHSWIRSPYGLPKGSPCA